eukprot:2929707-Prymnesium_polylepis.1
MAVQNRTRCRRGLPFIRQPGLATGLRGTSPLNDTYLVPERTAERSTQARTGRRATWAAHGDYLL